MFTLFTIRFAPFALRPPGARRARPRTAAGGRAGLGTARGVSGAQSGSTTPVLIAEGRPAIPGAGIIAEYLDETMARSWKSAGCCRPQWRAHRGAPADGMVQRQVFEEASHPLVTERIYKRFMNEDDGGGAPAMDVSERPRQMCAIIWLYRLAGADAEFPGRRPAHLRGPRRRGAPIGDRLSGRCAMDRGRRGKGVGTRG